MKVLLTGGGTAGHINPALAIADYLVQKEPHTQILYVGAKDGMEERLVKKAGYPLETIRVAGLKRSFSFNSIKSNINTVALTIRAIKKSRQILKQYNPDICIGTGGYVSAPIIKAAQQMKIPNLIHEQNAYPGVTTKMLARKANVVMLASEYSKKYLKHYNKTEITGNPIRGKLISADKQTSRKILHLDDRPVILSFGGSLGANAINQAAIELIKFTNNSNKYQIIHGYGKNGKSFLKELSKIGIDLKKQKNLHVTEYIDNMSECLSVADLVICRAGAITISELQIMGKAAILIPSPNVTANHQYHNAMSLVNKGAAEIIEEKNLNKNILINLILKILNDESIKRHYEKNIKALAITDSNRRIYNLITTYTNRREKSRS